MKRQFSLSLTILSFVIYGCSTTAMELDKAGRVTLDVLPACEKNADSLYNRNEILTKLAEILNTAAPGFRNYEKEGFYVIDERPQRFFIYDLSDPSNRGTPLGPCVKLVDRHIYHAAAIYRPYSFSHILFLQDGQVKVFKSINCPGGDDLSDVLSYVTAKLSVDAKKDEIINRLKNYREYGVYNTIDDLSIRCGEIMHKE